jgi:hypothetical protein
MYRKNYSVAELFVTFIEVLILIYVLLKACLWWEFYGFPWTKLNVFNVDLFAAEGVL